MFAKYSVGAQRAAPALARHLLCPKTTLYSAGINNTFLACMSYHVSRRSDLGHGMPCPYILEPYVEHGEQAQRSSGRPMMCFDRQLVRNAG